MGLFAWSHIWIYLVANVLGGTAAALVFRLTQPDEMPAVERRRASPNGIVLRPDQSLGSVPSERAH
jgi:aquaporin Z